MNSWYLHLASYNKKSFSVSAERLVNFYSDTSSVYQDALLPPSKIDQLKEELPKLFSYEQVIEPITQLLEDLSNKNGVSYSDTDKKFWVHTITDVFCKDVNILATGNESTEDYLTTHLIPQTPKEAEVVGKVLGDLDIDQNTRGGLVLNGAQLINKWEEGKLILGIKVEKKTESFDQMEEKSFERYWLDEKNMSRYLTEYPTLWKRALDKVVRSQVVSLIHKPEGVVKEQEEIWKDQNKQALDALEHIWDQSDNAITRFIKEKLLTDPISLYIDAPHVPQFQHVTITLPESVPSGENPDDWIQISLGDDDPNMRFIVQMNPYPTLDKTVYRSAFLPNENLDVNLNEVFEDESTYTAASEFMTNFADIILLNGQSRTTTKYLRRQEQPLHFVGQLIEEFKHVDSLQSLFEILYKDTPVRIQMI